MPKRAEAEKELPPYDLKAERKKRKITQLVAMEILCCSQPSITRWEQTGKLPLIYRKYWELYWHVEDQKIHNVAKAVKSSKRTSVTQ